jgi:undecaprenyl phosphate N,N'-diacetylbacillosamine 1-phosphate transferase
MDSFYGKVIKRMADGVFAAFFLIVLAPVFAVLALLVAVKLGRPVIFRQERPGRNGKIFGIYKFRTMTDGKDATGALLPDADRITGFGQSLRRTSLDELPELFNILKGDMSFVGPRPLLVKYLPLYNQEQARRHAVRPGLTGWAQVNGRNAIVWEEKFRHDVWYADHLSPGLDMKIIFMTIKTVVKREGISGEGNVTVEEFQGTPRDE